MRLQDGAAVAVVAAAVLLVGVGDRRGAIPGPCLQRRAGNALRAPQGQRTAQVDSGVGAKGRGGPQSKGEGEQIR